MRIKYERGGESDHLNPLETANRSHQAISENRKMQGSEKMKSVRNAKITETISDLI